ncbi:MAG: hypothetical protein N2171_05150 [Clostridia bacterium]|nr:hypothetical protein [Clostridia bacterium]
MNTNMNPMIVSGQTGYYPQSSCQSYTQTSGSGWQTPTPLQTLPLFMQPAQQSAQTYQTSQTTMPAVQSTSGQTPITFADYEKIAALTDVPVTAESLQYLNGFLRTQIGKRVKVEFLIGTNSFVDKEGILLGVGVNYILINETDTDDLTACDFYNIKFIKFYY